MGNRICRVPVSVGDLLAVGQSYRAERRGQQIGIERDRDSLGMSVDSAQRHREARSEFTLDSEGSLLRDRGTIARLVHKKDLQRREGTGVGNVDANWLGTRKRASHSRRCDAGLIPRGWCGALNQSLSKQGLEDSGRPGYAQ